MGLGEFWADKKVLITGHTGFKGGWLSLWLSQLGADVYGYALKPEVQPSLFKKLGLQQEINHITGDVRNKKLLYENVSLVKPDIVFHLAAQPLVRRSYREPTLTWETNVIGTINLLEALRGLNQLCATVIVTTDKVYENLEWNYAYRETDLLGGHDPYSSSKAAVELAVASWRKSYFNENSGVRIATARAGNVIGGGDWAEDRIIPDVVRSLRANQPLSVRNPKAIRPWQHVLDPLSGYMMLARALYENGSISLQTAFNFGPQPHSFRTVGELVELCLDHWPGESIDCSNPNSVHEATLLSLTTDKARTDLKWFPRWDFQVSVQKTITWYINEYSNLDAKSLSLKDIKSFESDNK